MTTIIQKPSHTQDTESKKKTRALSDTWDDWTGEIVSDTSTGKGLFLLSGALVVLGFIGGVFGLWILTAPRLMQVSPLIERVVFYCALAWALISTMAYVQFCLTAITERNWFIFPIRRILYRQLLHRAMNMGKRIKLSTDRMGHSFVRVSNSIIRALLRNQQFVRLLILLPRCLSKEMREAIKQIVDRYPCESYSVGGGSAAIKIIREKKPDAIVAVACERDLVGGLRDVGTKIPTLAVPNKRPHGPCVCTEIDLEEFEREISFFTHGARRDAVRESDTNNI